MLACATSSQGFGPLTGRLWGIRRVRTEEDEGERGTSQSGALEGSTRLLVLPHWESHSVGLNDHAWMNGGGRSSTAESTLSQRRQPESQVPVCEITGKITEIWQRSNHYIEHVCLTLCVIHKSCHRSFRVVSHCAVIDWGRQLVIHEHHRRSIRFSLSAFNGRLFYSLIKWDSTLPPRSHLAVSLHDNQLMHVQTPSGNAPYNNPDKGFGGIQLKHRIAALRLLPSPSPSWAAKG